VKPWLSYTLIRLGIIAVALTVLLLLGIEGWIAAILAALIGLCVAYLFFRPQRDKLIDSVRKPNANDDSEFEDSGSGDSTSEDADDR
jgi:hypothetical protein